MWLSTEVAQSTMFVRKNSPEKSLLKLRVPRVSGRLSVCLSAHFTGSLALRARAGFGVLEAHLQNRCILGTP